MTVERGRLLNRIWFWSVLVFSAYLTYDAFYPGESFYEGEFETVTLREIPASAEFIEKNSSYPDIHGDYCSSSQIRLSKSDYQMLLTQLSSDSRILKNAEIVFSQEFNKTMAGKKPENIVYRFLRKIPGEEDHYLYIGFYNDEETIFVNLCVT